jgi:hypothetical protein
MTTLESPLAAPSPPSVAAPVAAAAAGAENANRTWRIWLTRHPIGGALISGFVATHIATIFGIWFHGIGLPDLNWPVTNGAVILPKGATQTKFAIGEFIHGFDGLVFTLIFAIFLFPILGRAVTPATNMAKAVFFSLVLGTLSAGFMVPYVYFPHVGAGLFSTGFGWKTTFGIYLWHIVFGVNLGLMYNPFAANDPAVQS